MRKELLKKVKRIVVKIGSGVLTCEENGINPSFLRLLAAEIALLRAEGKEVVVVSSGAVAAGRQALGLAARPTTLKHCGRC